MLWCACWNSSCWDVHLYHTHHESIIRNCVLDSGDWWWGFWSLRVMSYYTPETGPKRGHTKNGLKIGGCGSSGISVSLSRHFQGPMAPDPRRHRLYPGDAPLVPWRKLGLWWKQTNPRQLQYWVSTVQISLRPKWMFHVYLFCLHAFNLVYCLLALKSFTYTHIIHMCTVFRYIHYLNIYVHIRSSTYIYIYTHICTYTCIYIYMYIVQSMCLFDCMYIYKFTHA